MNEQATKTRRTQGVEKIREPVRGGTSVRFLDGEEGLLSILEIHTLTQGDVTRAVYRALLAVRAQIVRFESESMGQRTRYRMRVVEFDGAPITARRRLEIQNSMLRLAGDLLHANGASGSQPHTFVA